MDAKPSSPLFVLVELTVRNFEKLEEFERKAVSIMSHYGGALISAFEIPYEGMEAGAEIHVLQFPSLQAFHRYREDGQLKDLSQLRSEAISETKVTLGHKSKSYS